LPSFALFAPVKPQEELDSTGTTLRARFGQSGGGAGQSILLATVTGASMHSP